jgi:hypothetical protein
MLVDSSLQNILTIGLITYVQGGFDIEVFSIASGNTLVSNPG